MNHMSASVHDPAHSVEAADLAIGRAAARAASEHFLRSLSLLTESLDLDILPAIILLTVMQSNVAHLDGGRTCGSYGAVATPPPDEERRPISVLALANGLRLPYETARRHVEKLIAAGWCARVGGGVIVRSEKLTGPKHQEAALANLANLRRLVRDLGRIGFL